MEDIRNNITQLNFVQKRSKKNKKQNNINLQPQLKKIWKNIPSIIGQYRKSSFKK